MSTWQQFSDGHRYKIQREYIFPDSSQGASNTPHSRLGFDPGPVTYTPSQMRCSLVHKSRSDLHAIAWRCQCRSLICPLHCQLPSSQQHSKLQCWKRNIKNSLSHTPLLLTLIFHVHIITMAMEMMQLGSRGRFPTPQRMRAFLPPANLDAHSQSRGS